MTIMIMMVGMMASSLAVVFVKLGSLDPYALAAYRQLLSALLLFPLFLNDLRKTGIPFHPKRMLPSVVPGVLLGLHFIVWIMGARLIPGGHAALIATMTPVVMPFLMYTMIKEKITRLEILGSVLALSGAFILSIKDSGYARSYIKGDMFVFAAMLLVSFYLALARKNRKHSPLWFYMVPLYLSGGLVSLFIAIATGADLIPRTSGDYISIIGLSVICTIVGHSINNYGMRKLRGQIVSLLNLTLILFATLMSFLFLGEIPPVYFYPAALVILSGPLLIILYDKPERSP